MGLNSCACFQVYLLHKTLVSAYLSTAVTQAATNTPPSPPSPARPIAPPAHTITTPKKTMAKDMPSRHAGLVTFNAEVCLIGDGSGDSRVVAGDRLSDAEALKEVGRAYPLSRPVSEARGRLADRLFALEEGGPTALGPAVVAGLSMLKVRAGGGGLAADGERILGNPMHCAFSDIRRA